MNYQVTTRQVTVPAREFIARYRDVERIRQYCTQCPSFGKVWSCPPFDYDARDVSNGFATVSVTGTTIEFDEQTRAACATHEQSAAAGREAMTQVWQSLLPQLYEQERSVPGSRCFTFRCTLCSERCSRADGLPCRHPDRMRHSLEAVGFDVVAITRDLLGIELQWSADGMLPRCITIVTALMMP